MDNPLKPYRGHTSDFHLWEKLKPIARQMRRNPTPAERHLWNYLRNRRLAGAKFRRQHSIERFIVDFICLSQKLVVEVDGPIHDYTPEEDAIRQQFIEWQGFRVIRFTNARVLDTLPEVLAAITQALSAADSPPVD